MKKDPAEAQRRTTRADLHAAVRQRHDRGCTGRYRPLQLARSAQGTAGGAAGKAGAAGGGQPEGGAVYRQLRRGVAGGGPEGVAGTRQPVYSVWTQPGGSRGAGAFAADSSFRGV